VVPDLVERSQRTSGERSSDKRSSHLDESLGDE